MTLSTAGGGGSAYIYQTAGGFTLENFDNTIQGAGIIGNNGLSLQNDVGGTVLANAAGQTLSITGAGTVTNNGTFQANSGSTLLVRICYFVHQLQRQHTYRWHLQRVRHAGQPGNIADQSSGQHRRRDR